MAVNTDAVKEIRIQRRTTAQIPKKALEILKRFKFAYRRRNATGQGVRANRPTPQVPRYEDLVQVCGHRIVPHLYATVIGLGENVVGDRANSINTTAGEQ